MKKPEERLIQEKGSMKKEKLYLSGSAFAIAQKCPASLAIKFSKKLMDEGKHGTDAQAGTDAHAEIAADIESMRRFLPAKPKAEHIEMRLEASYKGLALSGGVDYFGYSGFGPNGYTLHVVDWKTGPAGIEHLGPAQIEFYAYLILKKFQAQVHTVELSLVAPKLNQKKTFTRTPEEVLSLPEKFDAILKSIQKKEKPVPGEHCRYCNKRFVCDTFRDELKRFASPEFRNGSLRKITVEDLRTLTIAAKAVEEIKQYVKELLENGETIPGVSLSSKNTGRFWSESVDVVSLAVTLGVKPDALYAERKLLSPAQLEERKFNLEKVTDFIGMGQAKVLKIEPEEKTKQEQKPKTPVKTKTTKGKNR